MKKLTFKKNKIIFSSVVLILFFVQVSIGQSKTISGKVTEKVSGQPLPGVNVVIDGTANGSVTDFDGNYVINADSFGNNQIVFSFLGFKTVSVPLSKESQVINVALEEDATVLDAVVVTALGIKREAKALGYSLTKVGGDDISQVKTTSAVNSLQGRVAGVNISTNSAGAAGSSRVVIRGASSLTGSNQPLYIVDGIPIINTTKGSVGKFDGEFGDGGDDVSSINPDDIESISVLKGSSAAALYGSQASNGVIMITTKSGKKKKGFGVEYSSSITFEQVNTGLQDFQTTYGQGTFGLRPGFERNADGDVVPVADPLEDAIVKGMNSWGEKFDGALGVIWNGTSQPYSYSGDNVKRFYNTGSTGVHSIALTKGGEGYSYRISASSLDNKDVFPNSKLERKSYAFNANAEINPRLTSTINAKYIYEKVHNRIGIGDGPGNANYTVLMLPGNLNIDDMKPGFDDEGNELAFQSSVFTSNPYWVANKFNNDDKKNRIIASTSLRYDMNDWLYLSGRVGIDRYDLSRKRVTPYGTAYRPGGRLFQEKSTYNLINTDIMLGVNKELVGKISTNSIIGVNSQTSTFEAMSAQGDNFVVVGLEDLNNTTNPLPVNRYWRKKKNSVYGSFEVDYDNLLYVTFTGRNEWFTSLSFPGKTTPNNDFYWSLSGSLLLKKTLNLPDFVNYAKLRGSYAQVAGDTGAYALNLDYSILGTFLGQPFGQINGNTIPNPNLVPLQKNEFEIGLDSRFFNNRLNIDLAYYQNETANDIVRASATPTSGFTSALLNVGKLENKGIEFLIGGSPIKNDNFTWNTSFNLGYNESKIVATNDEDNPITLQESRTSTAWIEHVVGERYGTIVGISYERDENGAIVYETIGGVPRPVQGERKVLGQGVAPLNMGFSNTFNYKNFSLSFLIDAKFGGDVFSGTNAQAYFSGRHKETIKGRENGLEISGIDIATGEPFTTTIPANRVNTYYQSIAGDGNGTGIAEEFVYSSDFIKFRELSLSYSMPKSILDNMFISDLKLSLIGRNLFYISKEVENIDPESSINNTNAQGLERFGIPATRSLGFSVNVKF